MKILGHVTALGGAGATPARGDVHLEFELDQFGIFDFKKGADIIAAGYEQAIEPIAAFAQDVRSRLDGEDRPVGAALDAAIDQTGVTA